MPKRVDHAERRVRLAEAVWRVILREGVPGASVRGVSREAGLSMGSVRHFFATQDELLQFAMREVMVRARQRISSLSGERERMHASGHPCEAVAQLLEQALPLDQERLAEAAVWLALSVHGSQGVAIPVIRREADDAVRAMCRGALADLTQLGLVTPSRNIDLETERLWALLDGLTTHLLMNPEHTTTMLAAAVLRTHLTSLHSSAT